VIASNAGLTISIRPSASVTMMPSWVFSNTIAARRASA
jgi:hypothetical protein